MDIENINNISFAIFQNIIHETMENQNKPGLISNIAFTKYNESLQLDPYSVEACVLTGCINNLIIGAYYNGIVKFQEPTKDFVPNPDDWKIVNVGNGHYFFEENPKTRKMYK